MLAERSDALWMNHRRRFLKAYFFLLLLILGLFLTFYCSWTEISNHKSYSKEPECTYSEEFLNHSAESSIIRILHGNNGDFKILANIKNGSNEDITLGNYNSNENELWTTNFGDSLKDYGSSMGIDPQKYMYITGYTENFGALEEDLLLIKLNPNGTIEWSKTIDFGNGKGQFGLGIEAYKDKAIYVTGYQWDYNFLMGPATIAKDAINY